MKIAIAIFLFFSPIICMAASNSQLDRYETEIKNLEKKFLVLESKIEEGQGLKISHYQEILEKTNSQLSLWTNPYGLAVGVLSALLGFLAIGVTFLLYKQSADHKRQIFDEKVEREKQFKKFLDSWAQTLQGLNTHIAESKTEYDSLISEHRDKLKNANPQETEELKKQIEELKRDRAKVPTDVSKTVMAHWPSMNSLAFGLGSTVHKCSSCGFGFRVENINQPFRISWSDRADVTCPKCNNIDYIS